jgi:LssY-like putative type I secretion system component LssY
MTRLSLLLVALLLRTAQLGAQAAPAQDYTFRVSSSQPWTDTGLDLQSGETIKIYAEAPSSPLPDRAAVPACDPRGLSSGMGQTSDLPLPSAAAGALIARLHAQSAAPMLVGAASDLKVEEPSHLFLGLNVSTTSVCQGTVSVSVHRFTAGTVATNQTPTLSETATASTETRGDQLKSQLANAVQIFMQGQFGKGKSDVVSSDSSNATSTGDTANVAGTSAAFSLKVSDAPLDAELRKNIDSLPRRVNDQFKNLGDMVNFVIVGNQKDVQAALEAADWHVADTNNESAVLNAIKAAVDQKDYLQMPMSTLYLFGRKQDFGYEMAEAIAMVASRHHFRIWKAPFTSKGSEVWVGAGTHDIGFAKDKRNNGVTHKIDPAVDGERDNIGASLQKANKAKALSYYLPPNSVQDAKNATGDGYHSDGRLLVIFLQ